MSDPESSSLGGVFSSAGRVPPEHRYRVKLTKDASGGVGITVKLFPSWGIVVHAFPPLPTPVPTEESSYTTFKDRGGGVMTSQGPAESAGVQRGDVIVAVNGKSLSRAEAEGATATTKASLAELGRLMRENAGDDANNVGVLVLTLDRPLNQAALAAASAEPTREPFPNTSTTTTPSYPPLVVAMALRREPKPNKAFAAAVNPVLHPLALLLEAQGRLQTSSSPSDSNNSNSSSSSSGVNAATFTAQLDSLKRRSREWQLHGRLSSSSVIPHNDESSAPSGGNIGGDGSGGGGGSRSGSSDDEEGSLGDNSLSSSLSSLETPRTLSSSSAASSPSSPSSSVVSAFSSWYWSGEGAAEANTTKPAIRRMHGEPFTTCPLSSSASPLPPALASSRRSSSSASSKSSVGVKDVRPLLSVKILGAQLSRGDVHGGGGGGNGGDHGGGSSGSASSSSSTTTTTTVRDGGGGGHTEYVIWVHDAASGCEWTVRRRFKAFVKLEEAVAVARPLLRLELSQDFPPRKLLQLASLSASASSYLLPSSYSYSYSLQPAAERRTTAAEVQTVTERREALENFLRRLVHLLPGATTAATRLSPQPPSNREGLSSFSSDLDNASDDDDGDLENEKAFDERGGLAAAAAAAAAADGSREGSGGGGCGSGGGECEGDVLLGSCLLPLHRNNVDVARVLQMFLQVPQKSASSSCTPSSSTIHAAAAATATATAAAATKKKLVGAAQVYVGRVLALPVLSALVASFVAHVKSKRFLQWNSSNSSSNSSGGKNSNVESHGGDVGEDEGGGDNDGDDVGVFIEDEDDNDDEEDGEIGDNDDDDDEDHAFDASERGAAAAAAGANGGTVTLAAVQEFMDHLQECLFEGLRSDLCQHLADELSLDNNDDDDAGSSLENRSASTSSSTSASLTTVAVTTVAATTATPITTMAVSSQLSALSSSPITTTLPEPLTPSAASSSSEAAVAEEEAAVAVMAAAATAAEAVAAVVSETAVATDAPVPAMEVTETATAAEAVAAVVVAETATAAEAVAAVVAPQACITAARIGVRRAVECEVLVPLLRTLHHRLDLDTFALPALAPTPPPPPPPTPRSMSGGSGGGGGEETTVESTEGETETKAGATASATSAAMTPPPPQSPPPPSSSSSSNQCAAAVAVVEVMRDAREWRAAVWEVCAGILLGDNALMDLVGVNPSSSSSSSPSPSSCCQPSAVPMVATSEEGEGGGKFRGWRRRRIAWTTLLAAAPQKQRLEQQQNQQKQKQQEQKQKQEQKQQQQQQSCRCCCICDVSDSGGQAKLGLPLSQRSPSGWSSVARMLAHVDFGRGNSSLRSGPPPPPTLDPSHPPSSQATMMAALSNKTLAADKLALLVGAGQEITSLYQREHGNNTAPAAHLPLPLPEKDVVGGGGGVEVFGADSLLPAFIFALAGAVCGTGQRGGGGGSGDYVLSGASNNNNSNDDSASFSMSSGCASERRRKQVESRIRDLALLRRMLVAFTDPYERENEAGYYLATFEAAVDHIEALASALLAKHRCAAASATAKKRRGERP